ncbi:kelch-like protein 40 [Biomphalaria glabrata]|nr:kelch-like protein 40 [Biomphalaria glabrata]
MAPNITITTGIISSIASLWEDQELADFTVLIEDKIVTCHRFILSACSNFFGALFKTEMKEKRDKSVRLHDITPETFELILKMLYSGENLVNADNIASVWPGVHQLQIPFLIEHCEKFVSSILSLYNYVNFYRMAKLLDSKCVLEEVKRFMLKYFTDVKDEAFFLQLTAKELMELIESDALVVDSEDDVLFAIFKWIEREDLQTAAGRNIVQEKTESIYDLQEHDHLSLTGYEVAPEAGEEDVISECVANNDIKDVQTHVDVHNAEPPVDVNDVPRWKNKCAYLSDLLKASRACLASPYCLQVIYNHRLTQRDEEARKEIFNATLHQINRFRHGYFPAAAVRRDCDEYEHVGVIAYDSGSFQALSLRRNTIYPMPPCPEVKYNLKIALFDQDIFVVGPADDSHSKLCLLKENAWVVISTLLGSKYHLLSHEQYLYIFNSTNGEALRMKPKGYTKILESMEIPEYIVNSELAVSFEHFIVLFSNGSLNGKDETFAHCMDTRTEKWYRLKSLMGPAQKMASFRDGDKMYVLQVNGNLWRLDLNESAMIQFTFVEKLWNSKESLRGALLFRGKLFLYLKLPRENYYEKIQPCIPGVYSSVQTWARHGYVSNFILTIRHNLDMVEP